VFVEQPEDMCLHRFGLAADPSPDALIIILFEPGGHSQARDFATQWAPRVPRGVFTGLEIAQDARRMGLASLRAVLSEAAASHGLLSRQVVLLGAGRAGRLAIDFVLQGVVAGAAAIALDIPLDATPGLRFLSPGFVRLVQHTAEEDPRGERFHAVVDALHRRQIDVRSMVLPRSPTPDPTVTDRAAGTFLMELVAKAGRVGRIGEPWP
jgi:hypothetical protein